MKSLKIALDWTPNANHVGFYVAQQMGFYKNASIDLQIIHAGEDHYKITPAKKVELGLVDFALCPLESVMSYQTKAIPFSLQAIATLFKEDLSAIVCKSSSGIKSPKNLDGKSYASYKARYEDAIIKQMIINDGGSGSIELQYPDKLGIWNTIENNQVDATWIFMNWEGVIAQQQGLDLTTFKLKDYHIPYSYSPIIVVDSNTIKEQESIYSNFLNATKLGFLYAQGNPDQATQILKSHLPEADKSIDLMKCIKITCEAIGDKKSWGIMEPSRVNEFLKWLQEHQLENHNLKADSLFTNSLLIHH